MKKPFSFVFFGTPLFAVTILNELEQHGFLPNLIITQEDKPQGRHMEITPPETKVWAQERSIEIYQPPTLKDGSATKYLSHKAPMGGFDVFIVASYGKIIPKEILSLPKRGVLNVHPSLLPKLRGPSPVIGTILQEEKAGVTIMHLDEEMDHGPIVAQEEIEITDWPPYAPELEITLAKCGGSLLAKILPDWVLGNISEKPQDHNEATYTKKVRKEDAEIDLHDDPALNLRKIRAYAGWPNAYTFFSTPSKTIRLVIKTADIIDGKLQLGKVIPEGKREMDFTEFVRGHQKN